MAIEIKHAHQVDLVANPPDGVSVVQFDHWNAALVATMASGFLLGRTTGGTGAIEELTAAQVKAMLAYGSADIAGLQAALNAKQAAGDYAAASHSHAAATTGAAGFMTAADKGKLDGIAAGAQVNAVTSVAGKTGAVTLVKSDVGLANVDNTSDANKPVSTATQTALNGKANSSHTHTKSQITDFAHTHSAADLTDVGAEIISTSDPSGSPANGTKWYKV